MSCPVSSTSKVSVKRILKFFVWLFGAIAGLIDTARHAWDAKIHNYLQTAHSANNKR
jgi:hypothetical protein